MNKPRQLTDAEVEVVSGGLNALGATAQDPFRLPLGQALQETHTEEQGADFGRVIVQAAQTPA